MGKLGFFIEEVTEKTTKNNQYEVLTSSQNGIVSQEEYFNKQIASVDNTGYKIIRRGQFTYRSMSDTGRFYINRLINKEVGIVSPAYPVFKLVGNKIDPEYLELFFQSEAFQRQISDKSSGSTRLALRFSKLENVEIDVPSIEIQRKIVDAVRAIKATVNKEDNELILCDELIKSRFIELFDGKFPAESLYSVCEELFAGGDVKKDDLSEEKDDEHPYPIFTNGEANGGLYGYTSKARVFKEAVTVSGRGTIGYTSLRSEPFYPAVRLIVAVPNQKLIDACYLKYFIQSKNYGGSGSSIPQLTVPMIKNELIPVPPMEKQLEFKTFIHEIDKLKFNVQKRIEKYKELLNKKMDEYFN